MKRSMFARVAVGSAMGVWLSAGLGGWGAREARAQVISDASTGLVAETAVTGLSAPIAMVWISGEEFWITEQISGKVKRFVNFVYVGDALDLAVNSFAERGALGITLHPDFASTGYVYIFYSTSNTGGDSGQGFQWDENRVSRFTWNGTVLDPGSEVVITSVPRDNAQNNGADHDGGIIAFGRDGKLYVSQGDLRRGFLDNPRVEANTSATALSGTGGIFRLNDDGTIPADNPFAGESDPHVQRLFTYGDRNVFGMAMDDWVEGTRLWATCNGPTVYDEINLTYPGMNSGWLKVMGPDSRNAKYAENANTAYNAGDLVYLPGATYSDPEYSFTTPIGITAALMLNSYRLPCQVRGKLLVGETGFRELHLFTLNSARDDFVLTGLLADRCADSSTERTTTRIGNNFIVTTDLEIGPDGNIYALTYADGKVTRVRASGPVCAADYNGDCSFDAFDYDDFVNDFFNGHPRADFNNDGVVDAFDYDDYVSEFFTAAGC